MTMVEAKSAGIFVSHSHEDDDFGMRLVQDLRQIFDSDRSTVWYDSLGGLHGGDQWWQKIQAEIKARPVFIVILSPAAMGSKWVQDEIDMAWSLRNAVQSEGGSRLIIPVICQTCEIRPDLSTLQQISFLSPITYEAGFHKLVATIERLPKDDLQSEQDSRQSKQGDGQSSLIQRLIPDIEQAYNAHDWATVVDKITFLVKHSPGTVTAYIYRLYGDALVEESNITDAERAYDAATALSQFDERTLQSRARLYAHQGKLKAAEDLLKDALALANDMRLKLELLHDYAYVLEKHENWPELLKRSDQALRIAREDVNTLGKKLRALVALQQFSDAISVANVLARLGYFEIDQWLRLAQSAFDSGDIRAVRQVLDNAEARNPTNSEVIFQARLRLLPVATAGSIDVGDQVYHRLFGVGTVLEIQDMDGVPTAAVSFTAAGRKTLNLSFAKLVVFSKKS